VLATRRGIPFYPKPGEVLMCDFAGYIAPEIVKVRPAVVISADNPASTRLCIVVPFSTTPPRIVRPVHFHVPAGRYAFAQEEQWVKGDLIAHVRFERLDRVRVNGRFRRFDLPAADFAEIRKCVLHAVGLGRLALELGPSGDSP